ncbi:MAG: hypothetical protein ABR613_13250 [Actinomycetota bacterium]
MRLRAAVTVAVVLTALTIAPAGAAKPRRALLPYELEDVNHGVGLPGHQAGVYDTEYAYAFDLRKGETAVSVMVLDDREGDVSAVIAQWVTDGSAGGASWGHAATYHAFCTKTDAPVRVRPDLGRFEVLLQKGTCGDGTPSVPTTGDIVVDFHRGP